MAKESAPSASMTMTLGFFLAWDWQEPAGYAQNFQQNPCRSDVGCCGATFQKVLVQLIWIFWAIDQG